MEMLMQMEVQKDARIGPWGWRRFRMLDVDASDDSVTRNRRAENQGQRYFLGQDKGSYP